MYISTSEIFLPKSWSHFPHACFLSRNVVLLGLFTQSTNRDFSLSSFLHFNAASCLVGPSVVASLIWKKFTNYQTKTSEPIANWSVAFNLVVAVLHTDLNTAKKSEGEGKVKGNIQWVLLKVTFYGNSSRGSNPEIGTCQDFVPVTRLTITTTCA
jgi:Na+/proline symporter